MRVVSIRKANMPMRAALGGNSQYKSAPTARTCQTFIRADHSPFASNGKGNSALLLGGGQP